MPDLTVTVYTNPTEIFFVEMPFSFQSTAFMESCTCTGVDLIRSIEDAVDLYEAESALADDDEVVPFE